MGCGEPCGKAKQQQAPGPQLDGVGPGSQLLKIMPTIAKFYAWLSIENCGCEPYAALMDAWGIAGCVRRRDEIVSHLVGKAPSFMQQLEMTRVAAEKLVDQAISQARQAMPYFCNCGRKLKDNEGPKCFWCNNKERLRKQ